jgi:prepilin-type N-terminal cleavage/methylation domain-containing protein
MGTNGRGRRPEATGFTLVELMITVAIIGVLAVLATVGYARWTRTAKTGEATAMIAAIKGAQESYRAEALRYLDVSVGNIDTYFPLSVPTDQKVVWDPTSCKGKPVCDNFRVLNVQAESAVYYRYSTIAGPADGAVRTVDGHTFPAANDPWYVVKAQGDLNNNGTFGMFWSSSWDSIVWSKNSDE